MRKRVSIKDVAQEAGVSVATTSYVLNDIESARISADTARKVREAATRLNYVPSISARTMISRKSQLIGAVIPQTGTSQRLTFDNPFYGQFLSAVEYMVRQNDYHLLVSGTGPNQDYSSVAQMRDLDGIIILGTYPCDFLDEIKQTGIPVVLVDAYVQDHYFHRVNIDDRYGGYIATKYLIEKAHQRIAFVSERPRGSGVHEQRFLGYLDALEETGIPFDEQLVYSTNVSYYDSFGLAQEFVRRNSGATAAFVVADIMAMGLINGLTAAGWSIPEDLSVIGFDDISLATMCLPAITTVRQDVTEKGQQAAKILLNAIEGGAKQNIILPLSIAERDSVKERNG